jgi:ABC-2 type transport system permease protein
MNKMKWLIRREMWEHKGVLVWVPAALAAVVAALVAVTLIMGRNISFGDEHAGSMPLGQVVIEGQVRDQIAHTLASSYMVAAAPVLMALCLMFFYCLNALHDERRDRSILFWKSLPVSDRQTVLSKALLALVVAPLICIGIGTLLALVIVLAACVAMLVHGTNLFGAVLASLDFYLAPLRMLAMLPVYVLWALPTVGWLLMVSSMARSKPLMWAIGTPLGAGLLLMFAEKALSLPIHAGWFITAISNRILLGVAPGSWFFFDVATRAADPAAGTVDAMHLQTLLRISWATLAQPAPWIGVAAGVAMIAVAVWMRQHREES